MLSGLSNYFCKSIGINLHAKYFFYFIAGLNGIVVYRDTKCQNGGFQLRILHIVFLLCMGNIGFLCSNIVR